MPDFELPLVIKEDHWTIPGKHDECTVIQARVKYDAITTELFRFEVGATTLILGREMAFTFFPKFPAPAEMVRMMTPQGAANEILVRNSGVNYDAYLTLRAMTLEQLEENRAAAVKNIVSNSNKRIILPGGGN